MKQQNIIYQRRNKNIIHSDNLRIYNLATDHSNKLRGFVFTLFACTISIIYNFIFGPRQFIICLKAQEKFNEFKDETKNTLIGNFLFRRFLNNFFSLERALIIFNVSVNIELNELIIIRNQRLIKFLFRIQGDRFHNHRMF